MAQSNVRLFRKVPSGQFAGQGDINIISVDVNRRPVDADGSATLQFKFDRAVPWRTAAGVPRQKRPIDDVATAGRDRGVVAHVKTRCGVVGERVGDGDIAGGGDRCEARSHAIDDHVFDCKVSAAIRSNAAFRTRKLDVVLDGISPPRMTVLLILRPIDHVLRRKKLSGDRAVLQCRIGHLGAGEKTVTERLHGQIQVVDDGIGRIVNVQPRSLAVTEVGLLTLRRSFAKRIAESVVFRMRSSGDNRCTVDRVVVARQLDVLSSPVGVALCRRIGVQSNVFADQCQASQQVVAATKNDEVNATAVSQTASEASELAGVGPDCRPGQVEGIPVAKKFHELRFDRSGRCVQVIAVDPIGARCHNARHRVRVAAGRAQCHRGVVDQFG
ncbi:hypothetical protein Poly51_43800 [Rubripirellula tenax]|uniref:Uncharacterized protein n=1 Tax=Rubripirellula tenax TaxID=2528015 RepID=A0A5C6EU03_9BACT|nr:hypothetical protein Poly51_43800 [Rubripirellula tenax]